MKNKFRIVPFAELFDSCKKLEDLPKNTLLYSEFISDRYFTIEIKENGYSVNEYSTKKSYQRRGKKLSSSFFENREELQSSVKLNPEWYGRDVITNRVIHLDKWEDFLKSFEFRKIVEHKPLTHDGHSKFTYEII